MNIKIKASLGAEFKGLNTKVGGLMLDLKGDANLEQEGNTVSGDRIIYDIVAGKVDATAEGDGRVRTVLQPAAKVVQTTNDSSEQ